MTPIFSFHITVLEDLMPSFAQDTMVTDREFITGSAIEPFRLPTAMGGNGTLSYSVSPTLPNGIVLNPTSLEVSGTPSEAMPRTEFTWTVKDTDGDSSALEFFLTVIQDTQPVFSAQVEDMVFRAALPIDSFTLPLAMAGNGELVHELTPQLPGGLSFDTSTGTISGTPDEELESTLFMWTATDIDGDTATLTFSIMVLPRLPLRFPDSASIADQVFLQNDAIEVVELPAAIDGVGDHTYALSPAVPAGLSLDLATRQISGVPTSVLAQTEYTWLVMDEVNDAVSLTFSITVLEDFQPEFDIASGSIDQTYIQNSPITPFALPRATSGNGQLTYTLDSPLPTGLVLDADSFTISGTPTEPQSRSSFQWTVTDEDGDTASFEFHVTVIEDVMPYFAADASVSNREFITDFPIEAFRLPPAMGGNGSLAYGLTPSLPDGLELDENFNVGGTPVEALERTQFTWSVQDDDGDSSSLTFHLTVFLDTQPSFGDQISDKVFIVGTPIDSFTLPDATGGNGDLSYALMPALPNGLSFDADAKLISGTPTTETPTATYSWTVTDVDGDNVTLSFTIVVQPAAPEVISAIPDVRLIAGGGPQTVNARAVIEGRVDTWQVDARDPNVATASLSSSGVLTLTPRYEGRTAVTIRAANVTSSTMVSFEVFVVTDAVETNQIDATLALTTGAILSSAMNVFKKRSNLHSESNGGGGTTTPTYTAESRLGENVRNTQSDIGIDHLSRHFALDDPSVGQYSNSMYRNEFIPLNFTHKTANWSLWGAVDRQSFSSDGANNEIDGSISSLYLGADLAINENMFGGIAIASHGGSSNYEFASTGASGEGEIDTSLRGIYPYIQAGDGNRYSMFLVGGFGSGEAEVVRRHVHGSELSADTSLNLFAGGFDYVVLRRASMDLSIVGNAGVATITTEADSGVLANRDISASRSSVGSSVSFNRQVEGGSLVTSADVRLATGADDDESRTGFELGANLNFIGEHLDFMLDGRTSTRSGDADAQRSSLSARFRYKANADGSGLTLAVRPHWQSSSAIGLEDRFDPSNYMSGFAPFASDHTRSVEGEIGYGFWLADETAMLRPSVALQRLGSSKSVLRLGTDWRFNRSIRSGAVLGIDVFRNASAHDHPTFGLRAHMDLRL